MPDRREEILKSCIVSGKIGNGEVICEISEAKNAMDEYGKHLCLELIRWMLNKGLFASRIVDGEKILYYRGEYITPEQLFENFL